MEVILNCITNFEGRVLKVGDIIDMPLNIAQRWINRGIAHEAPQDKFIVKEETPEEVIFREPELKTALKEEIKEVINEVKISKPKKKTAKK